MSVRRGVAKHGLRVCLAVAGGVIVTAASKSDNQAATDLSFLAVGVGLTRRGAQTLADRETQLEYLSGVFDLC